MNHIPHNSDYVVYGSFLSGGENMSILLYEHNLHAYNTAVKMLEGCKKAAIIHPTGTGKSFIAFKLCEDNPDKTICWLSPSEYIFKTQIENVKKMAPDFNSDNITFITYAKLMTLSDSELNKISPHYIIFDEFHRCGAKEWGKGVEILLKTYPQVPILGLSATAIRYLDNQRNMADELFDGNIASEMTLGEAIVKGILNPPKYVLSVFSYQKELEKYSLRIKNIKNQTKQKNAQKYLDALRRSLEKADGLDEIFYKHMPKNNGKYIVFCASIEHMREMVDKVPEWFSKVDISPNVYSTYSNNPESNKEFEAFKEDKSDHLKLLFCIDMLNEGIHVDDISGVILLRPTVSPIIYKQQIGRALSASKSNDAVIFDIVLNFENLYSISDIKEEMSTAIDFYRSFGDDKEIINEQFNVIDEIRDCKELFEQLERNLALSWDSMYQLAKQYYEKHHDLLPKADYKTDEGHNLGQWIVTQRIQYMNNTLNEYRIKSLEKIGLSCKTLKELQWENGYSLAQEHYEQHGNLNVSTNNRELYSWILKQRCNYKTKKITAEQKLKLSNIGMIWEVEDTWRQKYLEAKKYYEKHGNLDIPAEYVTENGVSLGNWYRGVRASYRDRTLSEEKILMLEDIGIEWSSVKIRTWNNYYEAAKEYYEKNGNLNVKSDYVTDDGLNLGIWISSQRYNYTKKRLNGEQIELLEKIGMSWHRDKNRWEIGFNCAKKYYEEFGDINPAANYVCDDGFALGAWISSQRLKYKKGKLKQEYITQLESLNIIWSPLDANWEIGYEHACKYYRINGNCQVTNSFVTDDGFKLGSWVANQRTKYRSKKLSEDRIKRLDEIAFEWNAHGNRWEINYKQAKEYFEKNGNLVVANNFVLPNGFKLGQWLATQKADYKKGKLDNKKILLLERIGIVWAPNEEKWLQAFEYAKRYVFLHKSINIPYSYVTHDGFKLGEWCKGQKRLYKKGNYSQARVQMLYKAGILLFDEDEKGKNVYEGSEVI